MVTLFKLHQKLPQMKRLEQYGIKTYCGKILCVYGSKT